MNLKKKKSHLCSVEAYASSNCACEACGNCPFINCSCGNPQPFPTMVRI